MAGIRSGGSISAKTKARRRGRKKGRGSGVAVVRRGGGRWLRRYGKANWAMKSGGARQRRHRLAEEAKSLWSGENIAAAYENSGGVKK